MPNYRILLEYDGTDFSGWQVQRDRRTVQEELERVANGLNGKEPTRVQGAGRTDAGVHARGQVASFELDKTWDVEELRHALNGNLTDDIFVHDCDIVPKGFHARYSASRRLYRYYCRTHRSVIQRKYVWHIPGDISLHRLRQCAPMIMGDRDFTSFCKFNPDQKNRRCIVYQSGWIKRGDFVIFTIEANRFLQHLIRYLVGTMIEVAKRNRTVDTFHELLERKDPQANVSKAPPWGLFLEEVRYE